MGIKRIVVVGGGPAGMMAAIRASELHQEVTLVERNSTLGKKLLLSGKGRCNLTNSCELDQFLKRFSKNGSFLRDAFKKFFNLELMRFFEERGLKLKIERQLRVFPETDRSGSVLEVLKSELERNKVRIVYKALACDILIEHDAVKGVMLEEGRQISAERVIVATGGISYRFTGSTGQGLTLAKRLGHALVPLRPGLVPLKIAQRFVSSLEGLVLKNISLRFCSGKKEIVSEIGELLFTREGISGPLVLSLSGQIVDWLAHNRVYAEIDLKPGLSVEQLHQRLLREFKESPAKSLKHILKELLPLRFVDIFVTVAALDPKAKANQVTQEARNTIVSLLKSFRVDIASAENIEEAMVTRGGVSLKDIDPRTMESRSVKGLYFAGEMIDIDADTGGFNLQAAFSTGYLAGESASR